VNPSGAHPDQPVERAPPFVHGVRSGAACAPAKDHAATLTRYVDELNAICLLQLGARRLLGLSLLRGWQKKGPAALGATALGIMLRGRRGCVG
jgi:hypothetical protein